ncbi:MAG: MFS transporter [Promethearchaeota archaeon]
MNSEIKTHKKHAKIFSFYYFIEGYSQGIPMLVFPPYLADVLGGSFDLALWTLVAFIGSLPWAIKAIVGPLSDKWGSKKLGYRFPWIFGFGSVGGFFWLMMAIYLPIDETIYLFFAIYYFATQVGTAFSDTALDSLILDVTPKKRLGKIQGDTWTCMILGQGAGGMLLGLIFLALDIIPWLFVLTSFLMILASFLPYLIHEEPFTKIATKDMLLDIKSVFSKKRNYTVFSYTFTGGIVANVLSQFFNYVILIAMGIIDVSQTILSITSGNPVELLGWSSVFLFCYGLGIVIGSIISGRFLDRNRKMTVIKTYLLYIPVTLVSVIPFVLFNGMFLIALLFGIVLQIIIGALQGALTVSNQTIRGDLTKKYYPKLKSTYFALLVALNNFGQSFGVYLGFLIFDTFAGIVMNFYLIYFILMCACSASLSLSMLLFRTIDPKDYELILTEGGEKDIQFM